MIAALLALKTAPYSGEDSGSQPDLIILADPAGTWLVKSGEITHTFDQYDDLLLYVLHKISWLFLIKTRHWILHAGAFIANGQAIIFTGPSRIGKSSLTFTAWKSGREIMGDDCLAIDPVRQVVFAFPKVVKIRLPDRKVPADWAALVAPTYCPAGLLHDEYRWTLSRSLPRIVDYAAEFKIGRLYSLDRASDARTRVEALEGRDALQELVAQTVVRGSGTILNTLPMLRSLLDQAAVYKMHVGEDDLSCALTLMARDFVRPDLPG